MNRQRLTLRKKVKKNATRLEATRRAVFARWFQEALAHTGITRKRWAEETGTHPKTIYNYLHAQSRPKTVGDFSDVAAALALTGGFDAGLVWNELMTEADELANKGAHQSSFASVNRSTSGSSHILHAALDEFLRDVVTQRQPDAVPKLRVVARFPPLPGPDVQFFTADGRASFYLTGQNESSGTCSCSWIAQPLFLLSRGNRGKWRLRQIRDFRGNMAPFAKWIATDNFIVAITTPDIGGITVTFRKHKAGRHERLTIPVKNVGRVDDVSFLGDCLLIALKDSSFWHIDLHASRCVAIAKHKNYEASWSNTADFWDAETAVIGDGSPFLTLVSIPKAEKVLSFRVPKCVTLVRCFPKRHEIIVGGQFETYVVTYNSWNVVRMVPTECYNNSFIASKCERRSWLIGPGDSRCEIWNIESNQLVAYYQWRISSLSSALAVSRNGRYIIHENDIGEEHQIVVTEDISCSDEGCDVLS